MKTNWNINNVTVNVYFSPIFVVIQYFILTRLIPDYDKNNLLWDIIISLGIYIYSSMFFQPDLDQHPNKPGMKTFPLGTYLFPLVSGVVASILLTNIKRGKKVLYSLIWPINRVWFYFWMPYGKILTHRGISHWPVIGVLTRVIYIKIILSIINLPVTIKISTALDTFFFWNLENYQNFIIYCLPVYLSDFFHSLIDFIESKIKGFSFCISANHNPGLILRFFNKLRLK